MSHQLNDEDYKVKDALSKIRVKPPDIAGDVFSKLETDFKPNRSLRFAFICGIITMLVTGTAFALNYSSFLKLFSDVNPEFYDYLSPVELTCESDGIKMEVVAVACYGNQMIAYLTLTDLVSDRLKDGVVPHMDFLSVTGLRSMSTSNNPAHIDEETGAVTIMFEAENDDGFEGKEVTIRVKDIYNNKREFEALDVGIDLNTVPASPETIFIEDKELFNNLARTEEYYAKENGYILAPDSISHRIDKVNGLIITNYGIVDNKLRIQAWRDFYNNGLSYRLYLKNDKGDVIEEETILSFGVDGQKTIEAGNNEYWEHEFDVPIEQLGEYVLVSDIWECDKYPGEWSVTFTTKESEIEPIDLVLDTTLSEIHVGKINITPFGMFVDYSNNKVRTDTDYHYPEVTLNMADELIELQHSSSDFDYPNGENNPADVFSVFKSPIPIDLDAILSVTIDEKTFQIK